MSIMTAPSPHQYHNARPIHYIPQMNGYQPQNPRIYQAPAAQYIPSPNVYSATSYTTANGSIPSPVGPPPNAFPSTQYADPQSATSQTNLRKRGREEPVDWEEYFGGVPPKEIIVIDDDDSSATKIPGNVHQGQPKPQQQTNQSHARPIPAPIQTRVDYNHIDKRQKTGHTSALYDPVYSASSYSLPHSPYLDDGARRYTTSGDPASTYRSTAPTSLDSSTSSVGGAYVEDAATGQKRKRAPEIPKRRELEAPTNPYHEYVPPPNPPVKANDVVVPVISDRSSRRREDVDDPDGHYIVLEQAELTDRYIVIKLLGQGTFGKVVRAYDKHRKKEVAIKIIRSVQKYRDASRIELRVLSTLASNDKQNRNKCIHLRDTFDFRNHICIVTDLLGQSVFDFLKANNFVPFPSSHIQHFARQLFTSVAFLHDLNLIHTDLKPENILLVNAGYQTFTYNRNIPSSSTLTVRSSKFRKVLLDPDIRLIDFGSATFDDEYHSSVVSTRHYRAPEIILNLGWSFPCDVWSIGCILVEFFTGDALFQTHDNLEHLAMMEAVCDAPLDKHLIRAVCSGRGSNKNSASAFFKRLVLDYPQNETPRSSRKFVKGMKKLCEIIPSNTPFARAFLDLLKRIFIYDPKRRITAKEALNHPWFTEKFEDDGTEAAKIKVERERQARSEADQARLQVREVEIMQQEQELLKRQEEALRNQHLHQQQHQHQHQQQRHERQGQASTSAGTGNSNGNLSGYENYRVNNGKGTSGVGVRA